MSLILKPVGACSVSIHRATACSQTESGEVMRIRSFAMAFLVGVACQIEAKATPAVINDLRDPRWKDTRVVDTGAGVVQYTGDAAVSGGLISYLGLRLQNHLDPSSKVALKTADIRLSLVGVSYGVTHVFSDSAKVVLIGTLISVPISALMSAFEKNKSASAVICVSVDGNDYLGNDARLFRYGAETELRESIEAAVQRLIENIKHHRVTDSPACAPGWEGGQARDQQ